MSDRSDEVTESRDTDDLLEETERLLSGSGVGAEVDERTGTGIESETGAERTRADDDRFASDVSLGDESSTSTPESDASSSSRLSGLTSRFPVRDLFSPKAFLAFVLLVGTGLFAGGLVIPFAGRTLGMLGVAFAFGLLASKRRYLEVAAAGTSVGAASAVVGHAYLAVAGNFQAVAAVGATIGLVACLVGYYFGRDLRNGLVGDIDG